MRASFLCKVQSSHSSLSLERAKASFDNSTIRPAMYTRARTRECVRIGLGRIDRVRACDGHVSLSIQNKVITVVYRIHVIRYDKSGGEKDNRG